LVFLLISLFINFDVPKKKKNQKKIKGFENFPVFLKLNFGLDFRIEKEMGKGGSGNLSICSILNEETKDMFKTECAVVKTLNCINFFFLLFFLTLKPFFYLSFFVSK